MTEFKSYYEVKREVYAGIRALLENGTEWSFVYRDADDEPTRRRRIKAFRAILNELHRKGQPRKR